MKNFTGFLIVTLLFVGHFSYSQKDDGQKHPLLEDNFIFTAGVFFPSKTLKVAVEGSAELPPDIDIPVNLPETPVNLPEGEIDFGENFNISDYQTTFATGFQWRFGKTRKWKLLADYFGIYSRWKATLDEAIEWEDVIYDVDAEVRAGMDLSVIRSRVARVLSKGQQHELGVNLGAHIMVFNAFIEGEGRIAGDDEEAEGEFRRGGVDATAPLPNIGAWYYWAPSNKWLLTADVDWLYIAIGEFQGGLWDLKGGVQYQIIDWLGVGANYRYFSVDFEVDKSNWKGGLEMVYSGPSLLVNFNF